MAVNADSIWKHLTSPGAAPTSGGSRGVNNAWQRLMTPDPSLVPSKKQQEEDERKRKEAEAKKALLTGTQNRPQTLPAYIQKATTPPVKPVDDVMKGVKQGTWANFPSALWESVKFAGKSGLELPKSTLYDPFAHPSPGALQIEAELPDKTVADKVFKTLSKPVVRGFLAPSTEGFAESAVLANRGELDTPEKKVNAILNSVTFTAAIVGLAEGGSRSLGDTLANKKGTVRVTPEMIDGVLKENPPALQQNPAARAQLEVLRDNGVTFNVDTQRPAGGVRQKAGEFLGGEAKKGTAIELESQTAQLPGGGGVAKTPPPISEQLGIRTPLEVPKTKSGIRTELQIADTVAVGKQPAQMSVRDQLKAQEDPQLAKYNEIITKKYGTDSILSADDAKETFPDYNGANSDEYQKLGSEFVMKRYNEMLGERQGQGNNTVLFLTGGTGAGKTTALKRGVSNFKEYPIIYELNGQHLPGMTKVIQSALDNGFKVEQVHVTTDPSIAYDRVINRVGEEGRIVTVDNHILRHEESAKNLPKLKEKFGDKLIQHGLINDTIPTISTIDKLPKYKYSNIKGQLHDKLNVAEQEGRLTTEQAARSRASSPERRTGTKNSPASSKRSSRSEQGVRSEAKQGLRLKAVKTLEGDDLAKASSSERKASELKEQLKKNIQIRKTDLATLLRNAPGFKENPVLTVSKDGKLVYETEGASFSMLPSALGLDSMAIGELKPGTKITIDTDDFLKPNKAKNNVRVELDGNTYASKDSAKLGTAEQMPVDLPDNNPAKPGTIQYKTFEKVEKLIRKYAKLIGEGYLPRNARGVYYHDTTNIFIDGMTDVSVAAHEITHFLDKKYNIISKLISDTKRGAKIRTQLTDFYVQNYSGGNKKHKLELRMREGFASLVQHYSLTPQTVTASHPELVNEFLLPGGQFYQPVMSEIITDIREMVDDYQSLSALDKVGANVVTADFKTDKGSYLSTWQTIRTIAADDIYSQEVLDIGAGTNRTDKSVSLLMRGVRNHTGPVFQSNLSGKRGLWTMNAKGEIKKVADFNIGNLIQQLSNKKIMDEFAYYLIARDGYFEYQRMVELRREVETATTPEGKEALQEELKQVMQMIEKNPSTPGELAQAYKENKDRFTEEERMYDELNQKGGLDVLRDALLIDDALYEELSGREGYASKKRVFYNELLGDSKGPQSIGVGKNRISSMLSRKGSARAIQNPLYSLIKDHHEIMNKAARQHINNRMLNIAKSGAWNELFQIQKLKTDPKGQSEMDRDPNYIMARIKVGGKIKRVPILTDKFTKNLIDNILTFDDLHIVEKVLRTASTIKTIGTTASYPAFGAVNIVRDQPTAYVFSQNHYKPFYTAIHEFVKSLDPANPEHMLMKEFFVLGGDHYTLVSFEGQSTEDVLKSVAREVSEFRKYSEMVVGGGMKVLQAPAKYSEVATRAAEYVRSSLAGNDQWTAMEDAQRVSGPFSHIGALQNLNKPKTTKGQTAVKSVPFMNAGIQILDQTIRTLETPVGRKRFLFAAALITLAMGAGLLYMKDQASEDQIRELKGTDPEYFAQYIFVPKPSGKGFIRIPVPQNLSTVAGIMNIAILDKWLDTNYEMKDYVAVSLAGLPAQLQINPWQMEKWILSFAPQLVAGPFQAAWGMRTFPSISPVEDPGMKRLPSEYRYNEKTSPVAKFLGKTSVAKKLHMSPVKIDNAASALLGRATGLPMGNKKALNPLSGFEQSYNWKSSRVMDKYWERKSEIESEITARKEGLNKSMEPIKQKEIVDNITRAMTRYNKIVEAGNEDEANKLQKIIEDLAAKLE